MPSFLARRGVANLTLAIVCVAQFMVILDVSIVNLALPSMQSDLHFTTSGLQWVLNAYTLTFAGFLLLGGRMADLYGRRRLFLIGILVFSLTSLLGGLAQSGAQLITARAFQGVGGAMLSPATLTILTTTFTEPKARMRALGMWSAVAGAGGATGVIAGGLLTDLLSWRWILFINVPIGVLTALAARAVLAESKLEGQRPTLDYAGAFSITAGLSSLVYGIVSTDSHSWGSAIVLGPIVAGVLLIAAFVGVEARHRHPLAPLRLFRSRSLVGANVIMIGLGSIMFGIFFFLSQYAQDVLGYSPLRAGFAFLPMPLSIILGTQISSRVVGRFGVRTMLVVGSAIGGVGLFWLAHLGVHSDYLTHLCLPGIVTAYGMGTTLVPVTMGATSGVAPQDAGLASGLINTTRQIGGSVGLAVLATVATSRFHHVVVSEGAKAAQTAGANLALLSMSGVAAVVIVLTLLTLPRRVRPPAPTREVREQETLTVFESA